MATSLSLKATQFLSLGKYFFQTILKDDYPHKKFEAETFKATSKNNNQIQYKSECIKKSKDGKAAFEIKDELKFGLPLWGQNYLQTRVKRDGEIKYHFDFGNHMISNKYYTFFAAIKTDMHLDKFWARFGIGKMGPNYQIWQRIEKNFKGEYSTSMSGQYKYGPLNCAIATITNLATQKMSKCDFAANYNQNGLDLTMQHFAIFKEKSALPLGKLLIAAAYQINKQYSIGAWFKHNFAETKNRLVLGVQSKPQEKLMCKVKTDSKGKTTLSSKFQLTSSVQVTVGGQLNIVNLVKQFNLQQFVQMPFGYSLDVNL